MTKHIAYIPSLPDALQDKLKSFHTKWETQKKDILTHCRRELMHAVWSFLLDEEFLHAYKYGIVVQGPDQIERCVYPRIITYSADYPEKLVFVFTSAHAIAYYFGRVMLATIHDQGLCPCLCCLVPKRKLDQLGSSEDTRNQIRKAHKYDGESVHEAQRLIYKLGKGINGAAIQCELKATSAVPTLVSLCHVVQ